MGVTTIFKLLLFFAFLHMVSGVEIESVLLLHDDLVARQGKQLLIPCSFRVNDPDNDHQIELEWSVMPEGGKTFQPIIRLDDTRSRPVHHANERAWMDLLQIRKGHCSLFIDPVKPEDSGTYQVRIGINGKEFPGVSKAKVRVLQTHGDSDLNSKDTKRDQKIAMAVIKQTTSQDEDPDTMWLVKIIQAIKDKGHLQYLEIGGGVLILLMLLCSGAGIFFGCLYCRMARKIKDTVKSMEEVLPAGGGPEQPSPDIAVDLSAVAEPPIEMSVGDQWLLKAKKSLPQTPGEPTDLFSSEKYLRRIRPVQNISFYRNICMKHNISSGYTNIYNANRRRMRSHSW